MWVSEGVIGRSSPFFLEKHRFPSRFLDAGVVLWQLFFPAIIVWPEGPAGNDQIGVDRPPGRKKSAFVQARCREGRNPRTGETVHVEAKVAPYFKTGKQLREMLNPSGDA